MLERIKEYVKVKRRSKRFVFSFVVFMLLVITSISYAIFMISTDKYRSSEMFISKLMYGINIESTEESSIVNGKQVTVLGGETGVVKVTLTSLNPVDSNYKLQYKVIEGEGEVYYSDKTNWLPYGTISKSDESVYVKTIKVIIENTGEEELEIEIGASGGYIYNSVSSVGLISGYEAIEEEKETIVAIGEGEVITEVIESDTGCETTINGVCLYGGESKKNYLQYPTSDNKEENIWRIMGTYNIDGEVIAKMISETSTTSTYENGATNLTSFYNNLEDKEKYIYETNKFKCEGESLTCRESERYTNIGLINIEEYNKVGGINSYLGSSRSYFSMTERENLVSNITSEGIEEVGYNTSSGLRGVVYVKSEVKVKGSGTSNDPYVFAKEGDGDINLLAWTLGGVAQSGAFPQKGEGYIGESVECTNGSIAYWDNILWSPIFETINTPTTCTVHFKEGTSLYAKILLDNPNVSERSNFNTAFKTSNNGNTIYKASGQNDKDTYYFAGEVTNNYVEFGGYYWRIVRINEDNSVRLIYAGTSTGDTSAFINTEQEYNSSDANSAYVGYMYTASQQYGLNRNSSIKTVLDNWYINNLSGFDEYISKTAIYCNDRTVGSGTWTATGSDFYYAAYSRLVSGKSPTYICGNENDRFTVSTSTGNGKLTYPIGLITADEIAYAGGMYNTNNSSYYIAQNAKTGAAWWWTMSPFSWSYSQAHVFSVGGSTAAGALNYSHVNITFGVRPVISLKACIQYSNGNGTASDPYTVELPESCANVEN